MPGHLVHVEIGIDELGDLQGRLVSDARHERERKRALAHRDVDPEVAALQDHRDSALPPDPREGHGPEADAADEIDDAVAVRPEHGQVACSLAQLLLERRSCGRARLREPGGVEDGASRAEVGELPHDLDAGGRVHRDEGRVGHLGKGSDARIRRPAVHLGARRVHGVDRAGESERLAYGHRGGRQRAADEGDALRPEQAPDVLRRGAHPRRIGAPDQVAVDLGGALPDPLDAGVAPVTLDRELGRDPHAAEDLDAVVGRRGRPSRRRRASRPRHPAGRASPGRASRPRAS